jgi:hypothetical protein
VDGERDNLRAALEWGVAHDIAKAMRLKKVANCSILVGNSPRPSPLLQACHVARRDGDGNGILNDLTQRELYYKATL